MHNDFNKHKLDESSVNKNPFRQFEQWYSEAITHYGEDGSAMSLATVSSNKPSIRTVFLRGFDKNGFCFYTNYNSRKGKELAENNNACLLFFWRISFPSGKESIRQIRIEGMVEKLSTKKSDKYFANRPPASQIGAWASPQSEVISSREMLNEWVKEYSKIFDGKKIPRPIHWGGYRLIPTLFEFWQGRENRLHDRFVFTKQKNGQWKTQRLSP